MIGAILGDMIGAPYEFDAGEKTKDFPLFGKQSVFTDDSVMTAAVADALLSLETTAEDEAVRRAVTERMRFWGHRYPFAGYGARFSDWLESRDPKPYGSYGNGSAMRVSPAGWLYNTLEETRRIAVLTAEVTHSHPEGIKGAEAVASAIFLARNNISKEEIRDYIIREFGYDLSRTCDEIRPGYRHVESCQETVPEALTAFFEGKDFEDVIRTAVSLGGDCDTLTCIAGSVAEAFYGVPAKLRAEGERRLPEDMKDLLLRFEKEAEERIASVLDLQLAVNARIEEAIGAASASPDEKEQRAVAEVIRRIMRKGGQLLCHLFGVEDDRRSSLRAVKSGDGRLWTAVYTSREEAFKGREKRTVLLDMESLFRACLNSGSDGFVINPFGNSFPLGRELIEQVILKEDEECTVPCETLTGEMLKGGGYLKRAVMICSKNPTALNLWRLMRILRDCTVLIPCRAVLSDGDYETVSRMVLAAADRNDLDSLVGQTLQNHEQIRLIPELLQNGEDFFFPVFSSEEEMGSYGEHLSKTEEPFLRAVNLARNNEKPLKGIVVNPFTEPVVISKELFTIADGIESSLLEEKADEKKDF